MATISNLLKRVSLLEKRLLEKSNSDLKLNYYGILNGEKEDYEEEFQFMGINRLIEFKEGKLYLFSLTSENKDFVRFFYVCQCEEPIVSVLSISNSKTLKSKLKNARTLDLSEIPVKFRITKHSIIGKFFYVETKNDLLRMGFKSGEHNLQGNLKKLLLIFKNQKITSVE